MADKVPFKSYVDAADTANAAAVTTEATARAAAVTAEATARATADTAEATLRAEGDAESATAIADEATARVAADDSLADDIEAEELARIGADAALTTAIADAVDGLASESFVSTQINNLIGGAPGLLDTLGEIAEQLGDDEDAVAALTTTVAGKASTVALTAEETARIAGDNALDTRVDALELVGTPPTPGLILIGSFNATGLSTIDMLTRNVTGQAGALFQADCLVYEIEVVNLVPATSAVHMWMRVSTDGATFVSTGGLYGWIDFRFVAGAAASGGGGGQNEMVINGGGGVNSMSNTSTRGLVASFKLFNPLSTTVYKSVQGQTSHLVSDGTSRQSSWVSAAYEALTAITGIQIRPSSGTFASGLVNIYGMKA